VRSMLLGLLAVCVVPCAHAGAWGYRAFENDDALDWISELEATTGTQLLEAAVRQVDARAQYVEAPACTVALAAAEVIAAANGLSAKNLPPKVGVWIKRIRPTVSVALLAEARAAVGMCRSLQKSELRQLWQESKDEKLWLDETASLLSRLAAS
jgi:hypothetical protein